jgi:hypothetical protein
MGYWKHDGLFVNSAGERFVADIFVPQRYGDGCGEVRTKRKLADGEQWPPPKQEPAPDPEAARQARGLERMRRDALGALLSGDSYLDPAGRERLAREVRWREEHR